MCKVERTARLLALAAALFASGGAPAATAAATHIVVTTQDQMASDVYVLLPGEARFARDAPKAWSRDFPMNQPKNIVIIIEYDRTLRPDPIRLLYHVEPSPNPVEIVVPRPSARTDCHRNDLIALNHPQVSPREMLRSILLVDHLIGIPSPNQCAKSVAADLHQLRDRLISALHEADPRFVGIED